MSEKKLKYDVVVRVPPNRKLGYAISEFLKKKVIKDLLQLHPWTKPNEKIVAIHMLIEALEPKEPITQDDKPYEDL